MNTETIVVRGAREHNLRGVDLEIPRNRLVVFTGVSGSGKSSLAFDTLYAEGQRRYVESLSSYARQFLGQLPKPDVDFLSGLSPAISIQQKTAGQNPRSTVGTITEIFDFLRVLYARVGLGHCPECGRAITAQSREQIIARIEALPPGTRFLVLAPLMRGQKGEYKDLFADLLRRGFVRARVDGQVVRLTDELRLDRRIKHDIEVVIDRLTIERRGADSREGASTSRARLAEAVEQALTQGQGSIVISVEEAAEATSEPPRSRSSKKASADSRDILLSSHYACTACDRSYEPPSPQLFSFNSPHGMCPDCEGLGACHTFDPDLLIPDSSQSFHAGAIPIVGGMRTMGKWRRHVFEGVAETFGIDLQTPWRDLPPEHQRVLLHGSGDRHVTYEWKQRGGKVWKHGGKWEGIVPQLLASFKKTAAGPRRMQLEKYMRVTQCPACHGDRLNAQARAVRVGGKTLVEACALPVGDLAEWMTPAGPLETALESVQRQIAQELLKEIRGRLGFLLDVGLHYLSLDRSAPSLSGGEAQRIRLAGQIGCGLVGVLYVLDEPSIGLHPRDNARLLRSLLELRDLGNTVVVVEHDEDTMRAADYVVDFGPGPGVHGGEVVVAGDVEAVRRADRSLTGQYLAGKRRIEVPSKRRAGNGQRLRVEGARHNNLKNVDVDVPLATFTCVTGVSGSGKSSLVNDILLPALADRLRSSGRRSDDDADENDPETTPARHGAFDQLLGVQHLDKIIAIDQSPIGRTPRSNPATYIKVFDEIRSLFAEMTEAKIRGYNASRFSFNRPGGRCEACEGNGSNRLEMDFLADVWLPCPVCEGKRFNRETLQVRFKGKSIRDVLEMDVQEAIEHFSSHPRIAGMLQTLHDVGLDYLKLGQPSPTLSGGEAQRIKLARELCRRSTGRTLYVLDEPTTGLHFEDVRKLLEVLHGFVDAGNTVLVIEHHLDVVKTADWLIDLGPEGGDAGGRVVVEGTPETVAACRQSYTGQALAPCLPALAAKTKAVTNLPVSRRKGDARPTEPTSTTEIRIEGASEHNLKHVTVAFPRERMTVCCGPSGSGKSSLALDTLYAEGQRRYIESLSAYARQFLGQMQKPRVDKITGLSPAISIEQKAATRSPRSTVGTVTEIHDYLRVLFARLGEAHCPACGIPVGTQTSDEIIDRVLAMPEGTKIYVMAPIERRGQEKYESLWDEIRRDGFVRFRVDGKSYSIEEPPRIDHRRKHVVEVIVDRLVVRAGQRGRFADAVEAALSLGHGVMHVAHVESDKDETAWRVERFSQHFACERCHRSFEQLNPHHFSFNSPLGWCPACEGLGVRKGANLDLLLRDPKATLRGGALSAWPDCGEGSAFRPLAEALAKAVGFSLDAPYESLEPAHQHAILHGTGETWIDVAPVEAAPRKRNAPPPSPALRFQYKGVFPAIDEAARVSFVYRHKLEPLVGDVPCPTCNGSRMRDDAAATRFLGMTMAQLCGQPLGQTLAFLREHEVAPEHRALASDLLREVHNRLQFLVDVGLDYLTLDRPAPTLSGGETQRIRLASQIGSGLTGVLYVLDEPTIGLHPRDNLRLLQALRKLRDLGNTLVLVEHERSVIADADYLLDFGPGAGIHGGDIVARGSPAIVAKTPSSLTGQYLSGSRAIPVPTNRRTPRSDRPGACSEPAVTDSKSGRTSRSKTTKGRVKSRSSAAPVETPVVVSANSRACLVVKGARQHNLRNVDVAFPLGSLVAVTGVSGSGKSSLVHEVLYNTLARRLHRAQTPAAAVDDIEGVDRIDKIINVDQDPIGNSPSSNPATYTGVFDLVRQLFAQLPESKVRGYHPVRFSFNKPGGRCEACEGNGQKKIEMHFLPDVWVECDTCQGRRYSPETLAVRYKDKTIADVLEMQVGQALDLFGNIPKIRRILQTLADVGLEYLSLGQPAPTLSGGEAQRVKLAAELARPNTGRTLYLLDEPTTGLHFDDIRKLLDVLHRLVDLGNTVIVVEHNLDVIKSADWIVDLGPEAGDEGGLVVAEGTPEQVAERADLSHTAASLADVLRAGPHAFRQPHDPAALDRQREGDLALESVGSDARMPWQEDGRRWHTKDCVTNRGKPVRWEGRILEFVDAEIHRLGQFSPTNWNHRSVIEIAAPHRTQGWFAHLMTGMEWLVRLVFRVGRNTFKQDDLEASLGILPLNETPGLEVYGNEPRVRVANRKRGVQEIQILVHRFAEIDTPAFRAFLADAVKAFHANLERAKLNPEDVMPWKVNGERWHLSEKGFPVGKKVTWDRGLLPRLLALVREIEPAIVVDWTARDAIKLRVPGVSRAWAHWRTKGADVLDCRFLGKKGHVNLSRVERFGHLPTIVDSRDGEVLKLHFRHDDHLHANDLKPLLREHVAGFREAFGKRAQT